MASDDRRRKDALSCNGCRQRKVKCDKPSSGPCQRCSRLGKQCQLGGSTSRPYYHTSKERYELLVSVVRHFVPSASFGTEDLRKLLDSLQTRGEASPSPSAPTALDTSVDGPSPWLSEPITQMNTPPASSSSPYPPSEECSIEDLENTLMVDAMNVPRFSGSSSCTNLNAKIISHMSKDNALSPFEENEPPPLFDGQVISCRNADYLPNRKALDQAAMRFFAEINSVIYILDQDRFHHWLDDVYSGKGVRASVLVILYLVMALCGDEDPSFHIARSSMDDVIQESSLESVRALMLMSLYRQREDQRSVSWAMLGVAIRISLSLGLHQNIGYMHDTSIYGSEVKRRLWWSLCEFDNWSSCMLGQTSGLGRTNNSVSLPSQQEFNTTPYTPPGYATSSASLGTLIGQISQKLYIQNGNLRSKEQVTSDLIQKVETWNSELPDHLRPNAAFASCFARATLYLNLKYNYARMLIGRPYMAHSILCNNSHDAVFEARAETCKTANREAIEILTEFYRRGLLSSCLWLDTYFILATAIVLFLRAVESPSIHNELRSFLPVLKMCERSQIAKYAAESIQKFLHNLENGITERPTINIADPFSQSSRMGHGSGSCHDINFNELGDFNSLSSDCFGFGEDFDLDLCGPWNTLEPGL
ncbi:uncharacterized protein N7479_006723 [Penicillium vulpinum]|uniref:uncharacterized protein n=1 Tax=Penicillium vulpinum TaxID=29845 RepID=UPI002549B08D|nr:uncharacterized protein N7479_006723 [Penicillium vulpinum]KAJ5959573.1 hypothetical protein N7479_006723 [Penicillium vulpinum]